MKQISITFILLVSVFTLKGQALVTINNNAISVNDFKRIYEKNLNITVDDNATDLDKNLELFVNFKLKVAEAYKQKIDTLPSYKRDLQDFKRELMTPYLQDTTFLDQAVKDTYYRIKHEVKAKHILINLKQDATSKDSAAAYAKILNLRTRVLNGESFEAIAEEASDDPSARDNPSNGSPGNKGNLGFFGAFAMVPKFEDAAYSTKVGAVSMPFRTRFGYHIVKVDSLRLSKGEVTLAHLFIKDATVNSKQKIDSIYTVLTQKNNFEDLVKQFSDDTQTKEKGGVIGKFNEARVFKAFKEVAFSLKNDGDYSKPLQSDFGWHILKLVKKHPVKPFEDLEKTLRRRVKMSPKMEMSQKLVVERVKRNLNIQEFEDAKAFFNSGTYKIDSTNTLDKVILKINDTTFTQANFYDYLILKNNKPVFDVFEEFKTQKLMSYYVETLNETEPEYANTLQDFKDGLLLFEIMKQNVWDKASKDTIALKNYFKAHPKNFKTASFDKEKGNVISYYQDELDKRWIKKLRKENTVKINKKQLKKLKKYYKTK